MTRQDSERAPADPTTNPLEGIVGHWHTEGHVIGDEPVPVRGTDVYELFPGGHFVVHHVDVTVGEASVRAIEIIGERDEDSGGFLARAYEDNGAMTLMRVVVDDDGVWHFSGGSDVAPAAREVDEAPAVAAVRSTLRVAADRQTMTAHWERADDGVTWTPWMDIRFTRG